LKKSRQQRKNIRFCATLAFVQLQKQLKRSKMPKRNQQPNDPQLQATQQEEAPAESSKEIPQSIPKRSRKPSENSSNEAEILEELQKLERPSGIAGTAGVFAQKKFFKPDVTIVTGIPESPAQIAKIVRGTLKQNSASLRQTFIMLGGNSKLHFPDVRISGSSDKKLTDNASKYFSMIIPTKMTENSQQIKYFLRKGIEKVENETMIEFSDDAFQAIQKAATKTIFPYLKSINGKKGQSGADFPERPESVILADFPEQKEKLILRIDEFDFDYGGRRLRFMPNISMRVWKLGKTWYRTNRGVTMSSYNFYFFVTATMKFFVEPVKAIFDELHEGLAQFARSYEEDEELDEEPFPEVEFEDTPFPN